MEIIFLGQNDLGERIYKWLTDRETVNVRALLTEPDQLSVVEILEPDLLISCGFRHIVPEDILSVPEQGSINLHNSFLPYNRGANANVWSIIEDNPAGVTLHYMTADVDNGPIIDRRKVPVYPDDTARRLYKRLEDEQFNQFVECWPQIESGEVDVVTQNSKEGTYHYKGDFVDLWKLKRSETTTVGELIDRLRALTFPPYKNAYFEQGGEKFFVEIEITPASEINGHDEGVAAEYHKESMDERS